VGNRERREKHRLSVGKLEAKRPVGRPRCRWDDIKMNLKNRLEGMDWTYLAQGRTKRVEWRLLAWQVPGKVTVVKLVMKETERQIETKTIVMNNGTEQYIQKC
jgi:hypothetical protein